MAGTMQLDAIIMQVAGIRAGICTRTELLDHGVSSSAIERRLRCGLLRPIRRGVYVVGPLTGPLTRFHSALAAVTHGVLSHDTAAELREFPVEPTRPGTPVHLLVPDNFHHRLDGIVLHRRRRMPGEADRDVVNGLAVTSPALTLVDLVTTVGPARFRHIVQTQLGAECPTADELRACFDSVARRGVDGVALFRRLVGPMLDDRPVTRSALEAAALELLDNYEIEGFVPQFRPPWFDGWRGTVDFAHPEARVVLEADGRSWHRRDQEMAEDRRRDRLAAKHGWVSLRVTWAEIMHRPAATAADIAAVLAQREASPAA